MPVHVRRALRQRGLLDAYRARPDYQQNDYLGWIARAVRAATQQQRLGQMLDELERGGGQTHHRQEAGPVARTLATRSARAGSGAAAGELKAGEGALRRHGHGWLE